MLTNFSIIMILKKTWIVALLLIACSPDNEPQKPVVVVEDEPKQFGTPFAAVPSTENIVMYEVNMRAFSDAGNFQGIIDRLDNIKSLGVNTIWLMPIHPVGQIKSAGGLGSPYAVKNYKEVSSEYGDLDKFRELVAKAHEKNIAVIIDWVANHTSWDNPWITNKAWYSQDASGNIIIPAGTNWQDVADLNYNNSDMRKEMISAMKYWVLEANIDGFRCDAVDFVPTDFWTQAITELKKIEGRNLILLAEGGKPENFTAGFQMNYAWDFYTALKQVYKDAKSANTIFTTHQAEYNSIPAGAKKLRYTTNHDLSAWEETPIEIFNGQQGALSASVITIFTSAVPLLYSSQEVGQSELLPFFTRDPIDWSANQSMKDQYEKLLSIYNGTTAFRNGTLQSFSNNDVAIFKRKLNAEEYLILVNVSNATRDVTLEASLQNTSWTNVLSGSAVTLSTGISLQPYEYRILKK
jgi:glycosidase